MRSLSFDRRAPQGGDRERLARLTRHLHARLLDFGPGGPQVCRFQQEAGLVSAVFPGHQTQEVLQGLAQLGILVATEEGEALFYLRPECRFEDLDHVWGCLLEVLS